MRVRLPRASYANVTASLALFVALGGTGYAAISLPSNSVGALQIKSNAIDTSKVKNHSLRSIDFKAGQLPRGAKGATGAKGAAGPQGVAGPTGLQGLQGVPGPLAQTVPSGVSIHGSWGLEQYNATAGSFVGTSVSYPFRLPALPTGLVFVPTGTTVTHCTGSVGNPTADAGYVCVYRGYSSNITLSPNPFLDNPETGSRVTTSVAGFIVEDTVIATGVGFDSGTWAYTAP
jgi:hypothetical protein